MRLSFLVSWRNLMRHKKRFIFTLAAIILGVAVMMAMLVAKETTAGTTEMQESLYAGNADFWIKSNEHFFPENEIAWVADQEEVIRGTASLLKHGFVEIDTGKVESAPVRFTGVSSLDNGLIELPVKQGDITKAGVIITENSAKLWGKGIGDTLSFTDMGSMKITAIVHEGAMLNSPKTKEESMTRNARVMVPLDVLQSWAGMDGLISNYRFETDSEADDEILLSSLQSRLSGSNLFVQPVVLDGRQSNDVEGLYFTFDLIAMLSIFISAFIAFNMIYASVVERKKEFAIMKSLGFTNGNINQLVLTEIGVLSVLGTLLGVPLGILLGSFIQKMLMSAVATQDITYELKLALPLFISITVGIVFPFVAAAFPIYKAGRTPIMEAMVQKKNINRVGGKINVLRIVLGVICTGIGMINNLWAFLFLFIGLVLLYPLWMDIIRAVVSPLLTIFFKYPSVQASHSIQQFKNRNANTSAMLAIGVSLALFMSAMLVSLPEGMENDIRASFGGDIHAEKELPWTNKDLEIVNTMEGVENAHRYAEIPNITWQTNKGDNREFSIISFSGSAENAEFFQPEKISKYTQELPELYLGKRAMAEWGGKVGDILTLNTPNGATDFFVKGSVQTSQYTGYVAFVNETILDKVLHWPKRFHLAIDVHDESSIPIVYDELRKSFGASLSNVEPVTLAIKQTKHAIAGMNELMQGLLILIVALSAIGVSNTLFMNTIERMKEIGTMRAIGFTKQQVSTMIISEGLFIGITGVIVGTLYGIIVIYLNSQSSQGQALLSFTIPGVSLLLAVISGILFTFVASWLPSSTASRVPVKEAINYD